MQIEKDTLPTTGFTQGALVAVGEGGGDGGIIATQTPFVSSFPGGHEQLKCPRVF